MNIKISSAIKQASVINCCNHEVDRVSFGSSTTGAIVIALEFRDDFLKYEFPEQDITLDRSGQCAATTESGEVIILKFLVTKPLCDDQVVPVSARTTPTSIYLWEGFSGAAKKSSTTPCFDALGGQIELMQRIAQLADLVDSFLESDIRPYPGVFYYEVAEDLGALLFEKIDLTDDQFISAMNAAITEWIGEIETE